MATESTSLIPREAHGITRPRIVLLLFALYLGVMLAALDTTIVTTLMGHIASDLNALDSISWSATGYTVAYSAFQPIYGKLSDIWGRKTVSMVCTLFFTLGCLMCGYAHGMNLLVAGRFVSGVGAGGMLSMSTITVSDYIVVKANRGIFQGIGNICFGTGASLGGLVGGYMTSWSGWRSAFLVQVPLGLICFLAQYCLVHEKPLEPHPMSPLRRIDWVGSFSLVSALLLSMFGITTGGSHFPWLSVPVLGSFVASLALLGVFAYWETHRAIEPVMPIPLLVHRTIISACLCNFFGSALVFAYLYYTPLLLQSAFHYTYVEVGHRIVANFVGVAMGSLGAGIIMRRTGKYYWLSVQSGMLMFLSPLSWLAMYVVPEWLIKSATYQSLSYFLNGIGYASMLTVTLVALIAAVEPRYQAITTAAQYTFRGAGSSLGIAVASAVFQNVLMHKLVANVGTDTKLQRKIIGRVSKSIEAIWDQPKQYRAAIVEAYTSAGLAVEWLIILLAVVAVAMAALMREHELEPTPENARASTPPGPMEAP